jgi:hypothetical protein
MKEFYIRLLALVILLSIGVALFSSNQASTLANNAHEYVLGRQVVGFGGGVSTGGSYTLSSTVGQASAGELTGGDYTLGGGFWGGGVRVAAEVTPTATPTSTTTPETPTATPTATPDAPDNGDDATLYLPLVSR